MYCKVTIAQISVIIIWSNCWIDAN